MLVYQLAEARPPERRKSEYAAAAADYKFSGIRVLNEFSVQCTLTIPDSSESLRHR
jgi:hypothetical protein